MTEAIYNQRRAAIISRIYRHERTLSNGRAVFPRCLAADYRELEKLDREWNG